MSRVRELADRAQVSGPVQSRIEWGAPGELVGVELVEGVDDGRVELEAREPSHLADRIDDRPGPFVGSFVSKGVEDVGDSDDTAAERDLFAGQAVRIAAPV